MLFLGVRRTWFSVASRRVAQQPRPNRSPPTDSLPRPFVHIRSFRRRIHAWKPASILDSKAGSKACRSRLDAHIRTQTEGDILSIASLSLG